MNDRWLEEDEGFDLSEVQKPNMQELEEEANREIALEFNETKRKVKKVSKFVILGVAIAVVIGVVAIILFKPKSTRDLPFETTVSVDNVISQLGDTDYQEGEYYVDSLETEGIVNTTSNILKTPSPYGYIVGSVEPAEQVHIIGEVLENETNKEVNYFSVKYGDLEGFISKENVDIIWLDDCDLEPIIEDVEEEDTEEIDEERQAFEDDRFLKNLQKSVEDTKALQDEMQQMNEEWKEQDEAEAEAALAEQMEGIGYNEEPSDE